MRADASEPQLLERLRDGDERAFEALVASHHHTRRIGARCPRRRCSSGRAPAERARFEEHLADCPGCDAYLNQIRLTIRTVGAAEAIDEDRPEIAALLEAFRRNR